MISFNFYVKKDSKGSKNNAKRHNNLEKNYNKQLIEIDIYFLVYLKNIYFKIVNFTKCDLIVFLSIKL